MLSVYLHASHLDVSLSVRLLSLSASSVCPPHLSVRPLCPSMSVSACLHQVSATQAAASPQVSASSGLFRAIRIVCVCMCIVLCGKSVCVYISCFFCSSVAPMRMLLSARVCVYVCVGCVCASFCTHLYDWTHFLLLLLPFLSHTHSLLLNLSQPSSRRLSAGHRASCLPHSQSHSHTLSLSRRPSLSPLPASQCVPLAAWPAPAPPSALAAPPPPTSTAPCAT